MKDPNPQLKAGHWDGTIRTPQFLLSYPLSSTSSPGWGFAGKLIADSPWVVLEFDTSLSVQPEKDRFESAAIFLRIVQSLGLEHRHRSIASTAPVTFFHRMLGLTPGKRETIMVLVPGQSWGDSALNSGPLHFGYRVYAPRARDENADEGLRRLDLLFDARMDLRETLEYFACIIFDCPAIGQMGMIADGSTQEDLQQKLRS